MNPKGHTIAVLAATLLVACSHPTKTTPADIADWLERTYPPSSEAPADFRFSKKLSKVVDVTSRVSALSTEFPGLRWFHFTAAAPGQGGPVKGAVVSGEGLPVPLVLTGRPLYRDHNEPFLHLLTKVRFRSDTHRAALAKDFLTLCLPAIGNWGDPAPIPSITWRAPGILAINIGPRFPRLFLQMKTPSTIRAVWWGFEWSRQEGAAAGEGDVRILSTPPPTGCEFVACETHYRYRDATDLIELRSRTVCAQANVIVRTGQKDDLVFYEVYRCPLDLLEATPGLP